MGRRWQGVLKPHIHEYRLWRVLRDRRTPRSASVQPAGPGNPGRTIQSRSFIHRMSGDGRWPRRPRVIGIALYTGPTLPDEQRGIIRF